MRALAKTLALLAAALGACSGASRGAPAGEGDGRAERLYRARCSACHRPYEPESRNAAEWSEILARMAPRAHLREDERALLLAWLRGRARDPGTAR